ncbi:MAG: hypothetical protein V1494_04400 [Candidatus Diapherotrites archaeon]
MKLEKLFFVLLVSVAFFLLLGCIWSSNLENYSWILLSKDEVNTAGFNFSNGPENENITSGVTQLFKNAENNIQGDYLDITSRISPGFNKAEIEKLFSNSDGIAYQNIDLGELGVYNDSEGANNTSIIFARGDFIITIVAQKQDIGRLGKTVAVAKIIDEKIKSHT